MSESRRSEIPRGDHSRQGDRVEKWAGMVDRFVTDVADCRVPGWDPGRDQDAVRVYPFLTSRYYLDLARRSGSPVSRQILPDRAEVTAANSALAADPVAEDRHSPVPNLTHRYPDRVLFLVSDTCPVLCRFCTRKRKVGRSLTVTRETLDLGFRYIGDHPEIRDVLLSGGDPLMLADGELDRILYRLRSIGHVETIRIGTRTPAACPDRVTPGLASLLARHNPLYLHLHFNHPAEITPASRAACSTLADAGLPLASQTVLLRRINDHPDLLENLFRSLLSMRVRPYYLFQVDMVRGADHFRTPLRAGIEIMEELGRRTSPMALPRFTVDLPGGLGKVHPVTESVVLDRRGRQHIRLPDGRLVPYPDPADISNGND